MRLVRTDGANVALHGKKLAMVAPPDLKLKDFDKPIIVKTDASSTTVCAVLCQRDANYNMNPIQYAGWTMRAAEKNFFACGRKAFDVRFALPTFWLCLLTSQQFLVLSDQKTMKAAFAWKDVTNDCICVFFVSTVSKCTLLFGAYSYRKCSNYASQRLL